MKNLGQLIRLYRQNKGLNIQEFADQLEVSVGYLSNLETGKTETVRLALLERLLFEFSIIPTADQLTEPQNQFDTRIHKILHLLRQIEVSQPSLANYFLAMIEEGIDVFLTSTLTSPSTPPAS
jgi:transcriptional regulator with XRE-family HTH domain